MTSKYRVLDDDLKFELRLMAPEERSKLLFLESHPDYEGYFEVNCTDRFFVKDFWHLIGDYRAVSVFKLKSLLDQAERLKYEVVFLNDPAPTFDWVQSLTAPYPYELALELKPFQLAGFNFLKDKHAAIVDWSTGTGKSVFGCAKLKYLLQSEKVDLAIIVAKGHHRINWQRQIEQVTGYSASIVGFEHVQGKWREVSGNAAEKMLYREHQYQAARDGGILITNYEKFRNDTEMLAKAIKGKRVYIGWDEMPTKLKNPSTALYKGARKVVRAAKEVYQDCFSATPIENVPEDVYYCVKLMDKALLDPTVMEFRSRYVKSWNPFAIGKVKTWDVAKLPELGMRLAPITHQASKYRDPEIRAQFPEEHWETVPIEMSAPDWKLYDAVVNEIRSDFWEGAVTTDEVISRINVLRTICNNPAFLQYADGELARAICSKGVPPDKHSAKLRELQDMLATIEGKVVLFSAYNDLGSRPLSQYLTQWGVSYVLYDGTAAKMQEALDRFKSDPTIKVFLSSDKGSDSINLEEATSVINYDLPWKYSTLLQRVNRISRITSKGIGVSHVFFYNLVNVGTIEERMLLILERKKAYGEAVFGGDIAEQAEAISALTKEDLWWVLTGE